MIDSKKLTKLLFGFMFLYGLPQQHAAAAEPVAVGTASFYAERFHGRRTASGERYNMHGLTAATGRSHYPLGTVVRVTNLSNQRSIELRVNDRGPLPRGRILDVSKRAATELGFLHAGLARVKVEVLDWGGA
jgi:rare lipoprotein A